MERAFLQLASLARGMAPPGPICDARQRGTPPILVGGPGRRFLGEEMARSGSGMGIGDVTSSSAVARVGVDGKV
jgi:hypothetical protein